MYFRYRKLQCRRKEGSYRQVPNNKLCYEGYRKHKTKTTSLAPRCLLLHVYTRKYILCFHCLPRQRDFLFCDVIDHGLMNRLREYISTSYLKNSKNINIMHESLACVQTLLSVAMGKSVRRLMNHTFQCDYKFTLNRPVTITTMEMLIGVKYCFLLIDKSYCFSRPINIAKSVFKSEDFNTTKRKVQWRKEVRRDNFGVEWRSIKLQK